MRYQLQEIVEFSAIHDLGDGVHGHQYQLRVGISVEELDKGGEVFELREFLQKIVAQLDNCNMNTLFEARQWGPPTVACMAAAVWSLLDSELWDQYDGDGRADFTIEGVKATEDNKRSIRMTEKV